MSVANSTDEVKETVVKEIPPALDKLLLLMVKNFYSQEQFLLVYYIMRAVCIKEEKLRERVLFEHKQMREWLAQLKRDKVIRERLLTQKNENNRNVNIIFYYINYRALRNVLQFKIDHMRQRLEAREKDTVQKAHYKCSKCTMQYEALDIDRIFDVATSTLICWRCNGTVDLDESAGPTNETRSLLAQFNEQMLPMFAVSRDLIGVQLAPHLYDPDINKYIDDPAVQQLQQQQQQLDFSSHPSSHTSLGGVAFKQDSLNLSALMNSEQITVDLNAGANRTEEKQKEMPAWLTHTAMGDDIGDNETNEDMKDTSTVHLSLLAELEGVTEPTTAEETSSTQKTGDALPDDHNAQEEAEVDEDETEVPIVTVEGIEYPFDEVTSDMIERMTDAEKAAYNHAYQTYYSD